MDLSTPPHNNPPPRQTVFRDLWHVISGFRGRIVAAVVFLILAKVAVVSVPLMAATMVLATRTRVMGTLVVKGWLRTAGWLATAAMAVVVAAMFLG